MKSYKKPSLPTLCVAVLFCWLTGRAATIWNGPLITYSQPAPDPTFATNQDLLTPNVSLTRATPVGGGTGGMFNGVTETHFSKFISPADTEWAVGELTDYATLTYSDWTTASAGGAVHNYPGEQLVVHLISDDIYLSLKYIVLSPSPGFTYIRSTPAVASNTPPTISITSSSGNTLDISWPEAGGRLQVQTNNLGNNWLIVPNSTTTNRVIVPIDPANRSVFYRLSLP